MRKLYFPKADELGDGSIKLSCFFITVVAISFVLQFFYNSNQIYCFSSYRRLAVSEIESLEVLCSGLFSESYNPNLFLFEPESSDWFFDPICESIEPIQQEADEPKYAISLAESEPSPLIYNTYPNSLDSLVICSDTLYFTHFNTVLELEIYGSYLDVCVLGNFAHSRDNTKGVSLLNLLTEIETWFKNSNPWMTQGLINEAQIQALSEIGFGLTQKSVIFRVESPGYVLNAVLNMTMYFDCREDMGLPSVELLEISHHMETIASNPGFIQFFENTKQESRIDIKTCERSSVYSSIVESIPLTQTLATVLGILLYRASNIEITEVSIPN